MGWFNKTDTRLIIVNIILMISVTVGGCWLLSWGAKLEQEQAAIHSHK